jgi:hypothetical protein
MEPTPTPTPTITPNPTPTITTMTNQPDLTFINQFNPEQYVFNMVFMILIVIVVAEAIIFAFTKIFSFVETAFDNAEKNTFMERLLRKK